MRRFHSLGLICFVVFLVSFVHAQQFDVAGGAGTFWSTRNNSASQAFLPPPMPGGMYPDFWIQHLNERNLGFEIEGTFRYHKAVYNNFQLFRPFLYDANLVYSRRLAAKTHGDFMGGAGAETLVFYEYGTCGLIGGGCSVHLNSTHFLLHGGFGVRYYAWKSLFVRPEVHYYFIPNNYQFHSDNVFRLAASVGWTFGKH